MIRIRKKCQDKYNQIKDEVPAKVEKNRSVGVQTKYRETETQTIPWTPKHKVMEGHPEVLYLDTLKWGKNLPAGRAEVALIEFFRMKRAWDLHQTDMHPDPKDPEFRKRVIMEIEMSEGKFRTEEINSGIKRRMELAQMEMVKYHREMEQRYHDRVAATIQRMQEMKKQRVKYINCRKQRQLRKIYLMEKGVNLKYHKMSPIEEFCDPKSDFNVNIARFGRNPRYADEILLPECQLDDTTAFKRDYPSMRSPPGSDKPPPKKHDCRRSLGTVKSIEGNSFGTEKTVETGNINDEEDNQSNFITIGKISEDAEKALQAILLVQTLIRGRAVQTMMSEGLSVYADLVRELQTTHAFVQEEQDVLDKERYKTYQQYRHYLLQLKMMGLVPSVYNHLSGKTIGELVDISAKDLEKLQDERRAHQFVSMAEKTRWMREAAESGRRQKEMYRRRLHDEVYKHILRRNEITTDIYLELLRTSILRTVSEKEADYEVRLRADEIDSMEYIHDQEKKKEEEAKRAELMASLVYSYYLPELDREKARMRMEDYIKNRRMDAIRLIRGIQPEQTVSNEERKVKETLLNPEWLKSVGFDLDSCSEELPREEGVDEDGLGPHGYQHVPSLQGESDIDEKIEADLREALAEAMISAALKNLIMENIEKKKAGDYDRINVDDRSDSTLDTFEHSFEEQAGEEERVDDASDLLLPNSLDLSLAPKVHESWLRKQRKFKDGSKSHWPTYYELNDYPATPPNTVVKDSSDSEVGTARLGLKRTEREEIADDVADGLLYDVDKELGDTANVTAQVDDILNEIECDKTETESESNVTEESDDSFDVTVVQHSMHVSFPLEEELFGEEVFEEEIELGEGESENSRVDIERINFDFNYLGGEE